MVVVEKSGGGSTWSANPQSSSGTTREMLHRVNFFFLLISVSLSFSVAAVFLALFTVLAVQHSDIMVEMMAQFAGQKAPTLCFVGDTSEA